MYGYVGESVWRCVDVGGGGWRCVDVCGGGWRCREENGGEVGDVRSVDVCESVRREWRCV